LFEVIAATHAGMTTDEFAQSAKDWVARAKHPRFQRPYTDLVYQPMLELLAYLRASGFKTYIVSGGGVEFMRVFAEEVYGIPPEQVVGSVGETRLEVRSGKPVLDSGSGPTTRQSSIGRLDKALDEATQRGWAVVDMKRDWKVIYPFQR
jgi:hypothetical protein